MIERLHISHLRNLTDVTLSATACNVIIGQNGSGKTSLLEAIFLLSRGKSFRHHQPKRYIQHHAPSVTVFAQLSDQRTAAIQKQSDATTTLRLNQSTVYNQSILTEQLPTMLIDPSTMDMLEQGSASRRQLLDWLVFHMKPGFHAQWVAYQRLLKQRNSLLKQSRALSIAQLTELNAWDKGLASHAALIHHHRQQVFEAWQPFFAKSVAKLLPEYAQLLSLSYNPGYDIGTPFDEQLAARLEQDQQLGYTRIGAHRADVHVHWRSQPDQSPPLSQDNQKDINTDVDRDGTDTSIDTSSHSQADDSDSRHPVIKEQAANVLSRGEKKLLITALRLSQLPLLLGSDNDSLSTHQSHHTLLSATPVVLLDDVTAELDERAVDILLSTLSSLPCQVFITSLTDDILPKINCYWSAPKVFHVKQGKISTD